MIGLDDRIVALEAEVARLREALRWYADPAHWERESHFVATDAEDDKGERARAALEWK